MNIRHIYLLTVLFVAGFISVACSSSDNPTGSDDTNEYFAVNNWIRENMEFFYFWNALVPEETDGSVEPEEFYESMLEPTDKFSTISDDAEEYMNNVVGTSYTAGYSPAFYRMSQSNDLVFIAVQFVYPDTPADEAGLKRGDIILKIDGEHLTTRNYVELYYKDANSSTVTLGIIDEDNNIAEGKTLTLDKLKLDLNPIVHTQTYEQNGQKAAYIFYSRFVNGSEDQFIKSLNDTLANLQADGVTDLIVDLRYNPGGTISTAKGFANAIAPLSVTQNEEVLIKFQYNQNLQKYFEDREGPESPNLIERFSEGPVNLNLDKVYFLTTDRSASASELLINGLEPYLDVISIGTATYGKFYGAFVLSGLEATPSHNYAIAPVSMKYANALGVTDFVDGLEPDYEVQENLLDAIALGDSTDPLLAKALELIAGDVAPPAKVSPAMPFIKLDNPVELKQGNIFYTPKERKHLKELISSD